MKSAYSGYYIDTCREYSRGPAFKQQQPKEQRNAHSIGTPSMPVGFPHAGATKMKTKDSGGGGVFHERQRLQLCLLHALNNLLQGERAFTRKELDGIADNLPSIGSGCDARWWSPLSMVFKRHRNSVTGDYDVNVLFAALATRGKEVIWYDRRKGAEGLNPTATYGSKLVGIILNVPARRFGGLWKGRHWVTVRMVEGLWYNLDSDLAEPVLLHNGEEDLKRYLDSVFFNSGEALIVVETDDGSSSS